MTPRPLTLGATAFVALAALQAGGCGIDENVYNAAVKDRDAQKQKLADTQADLDKERAAHKKDAGQARHRDQQAVGARPGRLAPRDRARQPGRRARAGAEAHGGAARRRRRRPRRAPRSSATWSPSSSR